MDIPLDDPEANKAAAKIQAGFRGHMTRKKMKPGEKPNEEVSSSGEALNGSQGDSGQSLSLTVKEPWLNNTIAHCAEVASYLDLTQLGKTLKNPHRSLQNLALRSEVNNWSFEL